MAVGFQALLPKTQTWFAFASAFAKHPANNVRAGAEAGRKLWRSLRMWKAISRIKVGSVQKCLGEKLKSF